MSPDLLREAWLDGSLDEAGCAELLRLAEADPALAAGLAEAARLDLLLGLAHGRRRDLAPGVMAGLRGQASRAALRRAVMREVRRRPARRALWPWFAAAAAAVLVLAALLVVRPEAGPRLGGIAAASAGAELVRAGAVQPAVPGTALRAGDTLRAGDGPLRLDACGAAITLAPGAAVEIAPDLVHLAAGALEAEVQPHPADAPLVFATADARATVLGTALALSLGDGGTRLEVRHGRVRLQGATGSAVEVVGGGWAAVRAGSPPLASRALFPDGLAGWLSERGTWTVVDGVVRGGAAEGRSRLASRTAYGDLELVCSIRVSGAPCAEVQLDEYGWFAEIPAGGWRSVRIARHGTRRTCTVDGQPVAFQAGTGNQERGGALAFYVRPGGTIEIREAAVAVPP